MRVALFHAPHDVHVVEGDDPAPPRGNEVVVKVHYCGVCGTDLVIWQGRQPLRNSANMGHEYTGVVTAVGSNVTRLKAGDQVVVEWRGFSGGEGWSEYVKYDEHAFHKLPEGVSLRDGTMGEPLATCLHAIDLAEMRSGSVALILGGGPIGLGLMALARVSGAARTIVSETSEYRREMAHRMGTDVVVDPASEDLVNVVLRETDGLGADVAFDCVTTSETLRQGIEAVRNGGVVMVPGVAAAVEKLAVSPLEIRRRGIRIRGASSTGTGPSRTGPAFARAVSWLPRLNLSPLFTHQRAMDDLNDVFRLMESGQVGKIVVTPQA